MATDSHLSIKKLEDDLWSAADNLRANSKLTSSDYFMPVLGVIFLRHAANRFDEAGRQIEADRASGKMPKRKVLPADYIARRSLYLPEKARYDWIMRQASASGSDLPALVTGAMTAIEAEFEPLLGVLPKNFGIFEPKVLEDLMRLFNSDQVKRATGDVFGRIYEYFLAEFSIQKAHDNGEFFTPSSIVQTIVNVIEPDHGTVFDPACGSGGMFVQSSHFIEHEGEDTAKKVVFYGQEKNRDTINIARMNLAVHATVEATFAELIALAESLDAEQRRAAEEGLSEEELALFDLLFSEKIGKADRERLKQASKDLLASLRVILRPMHDWLQNSSTQAEVKVLILNKLWRALPRPPFTDETTEAVADRVYDYLWQRSASGRDLRVA